MTIDRLGNIIVREVQPQDLKQNAQVCKMINEAFRSDDSWTNDRHCVGVDRIQLDQFTDMISKNGNPDIFLYAVDGEQIVGTVQIVPEKGTTTALLSLVSVSPTHQSRGVGSLLMRECIRYMKENMKHMTEAYIYVLECRPELLSWYTRLGWQDNNEVIPFPDKSVLIVDEAPLRVLRYSLI